MKIVRRLVCLALLVFSAPIAVAPAAAQGAPSAEALAAARDLVAVVSKDTLRQMVVQMMGQIWPGIENALRAKQPSITAAQVADLRAEMDAFTKVARQKGFDI